MSTGSISKAITEWSAREPHIPAERIAAETGRSISTVRRWYAEGFEPRVSDVIVMESLKPGLLDALKKLATKRK